MMIFHYLLASIVSDEKSDKSLSVLSLFLCIIYIFSGGFKDCTL